MMMIFTVKDTVGKYELMNELNLCGTPNSHEIGESEKKSLRVQT
jgi:hypothetical protein